MCVRAVSASLFSKVPHDSSIGAWKVIENITERVVVGKDDVTINLCYLPSSSEIMAEKQRSLKDSWRRQA
jgi:hypothetical protein